MEELKTVRTSAIVRIKNSPQPKVYAAPPVPSRFCGPAPPGFYTRSMPNPAEQDPRVYFAAERTLLAWIRTGVGLMGFGFAIARFGLFLREMQSTQGSHTFDHQGVWGSPIAGVALIALGVIVNILSSYRYVQIIRELSQGSWIPSRVSRTAVVLSLLLAILGAAMAAPISSYCDKERE